jgi:signal transduction histidine kinase/ligand-binding sensor domain-containing protein
VLRLAVAGLRTVQRSILLAVMLLACCACALALDPSLDVSQYAHTAWEVRDGFARGSITSIAQTPDGYLWLGTEFGLVRFDGVRAVPWQPPKNQHLPSGPIFSLLVTRDGTLWIGAKGLASFKDGKLTRYPELADLFVYALHEDREGTVWVGGIAVPPAPGKLCAIRSGWVNCFGNDGGLSDLVVGLYEDVKGNLWVGVRNGLWRWKPGPPKFYSLSPAPNGIQAISEDADGALLVGWKGGIYRFVDGQTQAYSPQGASRQFRAHKMLRDRNGSLWIGTEVGGLVHMHQGRTDSFLPTDGLSGTEVTALLEDREGNIWVSTLEGLDRFRDFAVGTLTVKQGLTNDLVGSALADRDGSVWLGTYDGLNRWDHGQITTPETGSARRDRKLSGYYGNSLFQDERGRIWISTLRELGYLENGRFTSIKGVPGGDMLSITQDATGNLWVINEHVGLFCISPQNDVRQIPWSALGHKDHASVLAADRRQGGLWIGFFLGGIAYFSDGQVRASYATTDGLGAGRVSDFHFDDGGALWVSTEGGLSRLKSNRVATLNSKNGLPCDTIHWAIEDDDRSFWLYTACGLVRIARSELDAWAAAVDKSQDASLPIRVTVFDSSDGVRSLSSPGHYHPQVAKTPDGKLWFLPWDGVSVIDPRYLPFNNIPPPVHIENITADDKSYPLSNGVHLPAQIRNLDIDYTALSLVVPEKVRFRIKLEGQDKDWRELVNVRHVEYTNLPPKHYQFRVLACNNSGVWNEEGATLEFVIPPAWYQTKWFLAACVAAFLAMVWGMHELRVWQLAHQFNMRLEERVSERTRIARDLHDTLLQSFQGLMLHFQTGINLLPGRPVEARKTLETAIDRADQAIAEGRDAVQGLRASTVETNDLACAVRILGEELRAEGTNQNSALFEMEVEGTPRNLHPILRDEVYRIAGEALRNAFRHARAQRIEVEILYSERWLRLRVRDDGKGIDPQLLSGDELAGHYGLHGMRERAKLVGGKLAVWSKFDSGTEVELSIPASTAYAKASRHRSWLSERLAGQRTDFKETEVKVTKTKS